MQLGFNILVFTAVIYFCHAEVVLKQGENQTVAFEGNELIILLENPQKQDKPFKMCFGSTPEVRYEFCPPGYGGVWINVIETRTYKLNRQGQLGVDLTISDNVVFNSDGSINVLVVGMPYGAIVKLLNAKIPVATTTSATRKRDTNNNALTPVIVIVVLLILFIFIIGAIVLYFCWYRKRSNRPTATTDSEVHQPLERVRKPNKTQPQMATKSYVPPPPKRQTLMPSTTTSTRRASEDKPQFVVATKPAPIAPVASPAHCVSLIHPSTQTSTPNAVSILKSGMTKQSRKSRRHVTTTTKTTQCNKPTKPSNLNRKYNEDPFSNSHTEPSQCDKQSRKSSESSRR